MLKPVAKIYVTAALLCGTAQAETNAPPLTWQFDQTVGVDTHLNYGDSTYGSGGTYDYPLAMTEAQYLFGSHWPINIRDGFSNGPGGSGEPPISYYCEFADPTTGFQRVAFTAGIEVPGGMGSMTASLSGLSAQLLLAEDVTQCKNSSVPYLEGDNEAQNATWTNDTANTPQAVNDQAAGLVSLVSTAISNGYLAKSTKIVFSTDWTSGAIQPPDTIDPVAAGLATYDNTHPYPGFGSSPYSAISVDYANGPKDPKFATEFGYPVCGLTGGTACNAAPHTGNQPYVDENTRAHYMLDAVMDASQLGLTRIFFYELENGYAPGSSNFSPWGLFYYDGAFTTANNNIFNADGTPNTTYVSATAIGIHNLFSILADSDNSLKKATKLAYSVTGLPATCYGTQSQSTVPCTTTEALENSNGNYFVVVWAEPKIWDITTETEVTPPNNMVTLTLPASGFSTYQVYDPSITVGSTEIAFGSYTSTLNVNVTDHPIIIALLQ